MAKRTYAIMGATGQIGRVLTEELLKRGREVRVLGRDRERLAALEAKGAKPYPVPFDQAAPLAEAFRGASAAFSLIPPSYGEDDFGGYQDRVGEAIVAALRKAGTTHVVNLSSVGAHLPEGTGPIKGLHRQEKRLEATAGLNVLHLRPNYFMENQLWAVPTIKSQGLNGSPLRGDLPIAMVATRDIGVKAAALLDRLDFRGSTVLEFVGPRPVTLSEVTTVLGRAIGKPDLRYIQFPYEEARKAMIASGMKAGIVDLFIEMQRAFNDGRVAPTQQLDPDHKGKTTIEEFARVFAEAYRGA